MLESPREEWNGAGGGGTEEHLVLEQGLKEV